MAPVDRRWPATLMMSSVRAIFKMVCVVVVSSLSMLVSMTSFTKAYMTALPMENERKYRWRERIRKPEGSIVRRRGNHAPEMFTQLLDTLGD